MIINKDSLDAALNKSLAVHNNRIGHNDHLFLRRIYGDGLMKYQDRLQAIGFSEHDHVLDAGCGYGQWSLALAEMNRKVSSCDISSLRIDLLSDLTKNLGVKNIDLRVSGIDIMPYPDACFDAVFCYGVIFLTPWRQSLAELTRVLKPGGKLYVNANGLGWYIFLWQEEHNKANDYDPKAIAAKTLADSLVYDRQGLYEPGMSLIIEPEALKKELEVLGFAQIEIGPEGGLHFGQSVPPPKPFFKGDYYGQVGVYEVVAVKR
jgi:ubiquinone/menaquinone biosynthesis C-methylase UbiE